MKKYYCTVKATLCDIVASSKREAAEKALSIAMKAPEILHCDYVDDGIETYVKFTKTETREVETEL